MAKYNPLGQSEAEYKEYQKLSFLKKTIESMEEEKVDEYSIILGRIHRWVTQALDLRAEDVRNRRDTIAILKHEREQALAEDKSRTEKREAALEEKQTVSQQINSNLVTDHYFLSRNTKRKKLKTRKSTWKIKILRMKTETRSRK